MSLAVLVKWGLHHQVSLSLCWVSEPDCFSKVRFAPSSFVVVVLSEWDWLFQNGPHLQPPAPHDEHHGVLHEQLVGVDLQQHRHAHQRHVPRRTQGSQCRVRFHYWTMITHSEYTRYSDSTLDTSVSEFQKIITHTHTHSFWKRIVI